MRMNLLRVGVVSVFAAGLVSCGGEEALPLTATSTSGVMTQLNSILLQFPKSNTAITLPGNGGLGTLGASSSSPDGLKTLAATECETVTPNPVVDADGDNIAATKTGTFDCSDHVMNGYSYNRKGSYTVTDLDDTKAGMLGGMEVKYNLSNFSYKSPSNESFSGSHLGYWRFKGDSAGGLTSTSDYTGHYGFQGTGNTADYKVDFDFHYAWEWALKPNDPVNTWTSGTITFSGSYYMKGEFMNEDHSGKHQAVNGAWKLNYKSSNLKYDSACSWWYRSGSVLVDDTNGNTLEVRYLCTGAEFYVNGKKSDLYTPSNS